MSQVSSYIARCEEVIDGSSRENPGSLVEEIVSVFAGRDDKIRHGLDRYRSRVSVGDGGANYDNLGDIRKLLGKLRLISEEEQAALLKSDSPTAYLDSLVRRCDDALSSSASLSERKSLLEEICYGAYCQKNPWFATGLEFFTVDHDSDDYGEGSVANDIRLARGKLLSIREEALGEIARSSRGPVAVATSSSTANVNVTIAQVLHDIDSVDESEATPAEKDEIKGLLNEVESSKVPSKREKAVKAVLEWLSKHSMDLITLTLPYIMKAQGLA